MADVDDDAVGINGLDEVFETSDEDQPEADNVSDQDDADEESKKDDAQSDKGEKDAETPSAEQDKAANGDPDEVPKGHIPIAAYQDEKRKRQALEEEIQNLRNPSKEKQEEEKVDLFADPDKFVASVDKRLAQSELKTRITLSREFYSDLKPDYAEKEKRFMEMANDNPSLAAKMREHSNPAKFAYETAAKQMAMDEVVQDPDAYREKIRQELLAELNPDETPAPADKKAEQVKVAPSLATAPAVKPESEKEDTLDSMFADSQL